MASKHLTHLHQQNRESLARGPLTLPTTRAGTHSMKPPPPPWVRNESEVKISLSGLEWKTLGVFLREA